MISKLADIAHFETFIMATKSIKMSHKTLGNTFIVKILFTNTIQEFHCLPNRGCLPFGQLKLHTH